MLALPIMWEYGECGTCVCVCGGVGGGGGRKWLGGLFQEGWSCVMYVCIMSMGSLCRWKVQV